MRILVALLALFVLLAGAGAFWADKLVDPWFAAHATHGNKDVASIVSQVGDWPWLCAAGVAALLVAAKFNRQKATRILLAMLIASALAGLISNTVKSVTGRTRPNAKGAEQGWYGMKRGEEWLIGKNKFNSFPSSHTACAVAFALPLFGFGLVPGILGTLGALTVGWARLQLGVHHGSDVTWGAITGIFSVWVISRQHALLSRWADAICGKISGTPPPTAIPGPDRQGALH